VEYCANNHVSVLKSAVEKLRITNPVGKSIILYKEQNGRSVPDRSGQIVGVINDYNYRPNYEPSGGQYSVTIQTGLILY
jgi:hypothetical protein